MRIYVAGPYTSDPEVCTTAAIAAGDMLLYMGHEPFVPHLAHYWDTIHTYHPYQDWMRLDLAWLEVAEGVLRLEGESPGADQEVSRAKELGIPVYYSLEEIPRA